MNISELLTEEGILLNAAVADKDDAIRMLVDNTNRFDVISDAALCRADVLARERQGTTALSHGVAIPHAKSRGVTGRGIMAMTVPDGVDFGEREPSKLIFLLVGPESDPSGYLEMLSSLLMLLLKNEGLTEALTAAKTSGEFLRLLKDAESK